MALREKFGATSLILDSPPIKQKETEPKMGRMVLSVNHDATTDEPDGRDGSWWPCDQAGADRETDQLLRLSPVKRSQLGDSHR